MDKARGDLLLSPYRILDLTDERGLLCGKILADLGADVVQIEPPGGSSARRIGPFYRDQVHPEKSLFWWAYAANKRAITLDLGTDDGAALLRRLARDAHFLIESFSPGHLDGLGLGCDHLAQINPGLVMVSITPFGQDGPYSLYKAPDIVGIALGGLTYLTGDADRPPLRVGFPQFYLHGAAAAATGAMLAHTHRALTGEGQHVDVSCQQAVAKCLAHAPQSWDMEGEVIRRMGVYRQTSSDSVVRISWRCKDGHVNFVPQGGGAGVARSTRAMLGWMTEEGMGNEELDAVNWEEMGYGQVPADIMSKTVASVEHFIITHTKAELVRESVERRILLFPVATQGDILQHPQLEARGYFTELHHPELNASVRYPGMFVKESGNGRVGLHRRPPTIGEHNLEIYHGELGLAPEDLAALKQWGVI